MFYDNEIKPEISNTRKEKTEKFTNRTKNTRQIKEEITIA